jgi:hypothetical protein
MCKPRLNNHDCHESEESTDVPYPACHTMKQVSDQPRLDMNALDLWWWWCAVNDASSAWEEKECILPTPHPRSSTSA